MPSAYNRSGRNIYPGYAVVVNGNSARLPNANETVTHLALDGSPPNGVVVMAANGELDLSDWTLATGSRYLTPGQAYYAAFGKLATAGAQAVGVAISPTKLSISIAPYQIIAANVPLAPTPPAPIQAPLQIGDGLPAYDLGEVGSFYINRTTHELFGPKGTGGWGTGWAFWHS